MHSVRGPNRLARPTVMSSSASPPLSVVIPNFNHGAVVGQAIRAIAEQIPAAGEIIVVDDGSTDNSAEVLERLAQEIPKLRVLRLEENRGAIFALNHGLKNARGNYINFGAADDLVRDAERFLSGMLARDIRGCPPGHAHYTTWLDDRGFVLEDGVIQHRAPDEFLLTSAEPNFAWFADRIGRLDVTLEEVSLDIGALAVQGPRSRDLLARLVPQVSELPFFGLAPGTIAGRPVTVSRTVKLPSCG